MAQVAGECVFVSGGSLIFSAGGRDELPVFSRPVQIFPPEGVARIPENATWAAERVPGEKRWTLRIYDRRSLILELDVMPQAQSLLSGTDHPINAIAADLGFQSATAFSASFHRSTSLTPSDYRARKR